MRHLKKPVIIFLVTSLLLLTLFPFVEWSPTYGNVNEFYWGTYSEQVSLKRFDFIFNPTIQRLVYRDVMGSKTFTDPLIFDKFKKRDEVTVLSTMIRDSINIFSTDSLKMAVITSSLPQYIPNYDRTKAKILYDYVSTATKFNKADFTKDFNTFMDYLINNPRGVEALYKQIRSGGLYKLHFKESYQDFLWLGLGVGYPDLRNLKPITFKVYDVKYIQSMSANFSRDINLGLQLLGYLIIILLGFIIQYIFINHKSN